MYPAYIKGKITIIFYFSEMIQAGIDSLYRILGVFCSWSKCLISPFKTYIFTMCYQFKLPFIEILSSLNKIIRMFIKRDGKNSISSKKIATFCINSACMLSCFTVTQLQPYGLQPPRLLCPWDSPSKNTGMGWHACLKPTSSALAGGLFTTSATWEAGINSSCGVCESPDGASGKEPTCQSRRHKRFGYDPRVRKIPWRRKWQPTPVVLPEKPHGQR